MLIKDLSIELDAKAMTEVTGAGDVYNVQSNDSHQIAGGVKSLTAQSGIGNVSLNVAANQQFAEQANLATIVNKDSFKKEITVVDLF